MKKLSRIFSIAIASVILMATILMSFQEHPVYAEGEVYQSQQLCATVENDIVTEINIIGEPQENSKGIEVIAFETSGGFLWFKDDNKLNIVSRKKTDGVFNGKQKIGNITLVLSEKDTWAKFKERVLKDWDTKVFTMKAKGLAIEGDWNLEYNVDIVEVASSDPNTHCLVAKAIEGKYTEGEANNQGTAIIGGDEDDGDMDMKSCKKAMSLGWFICPILKGLSNLAGKIYGSIIEPALALEPSLISGGDGSQGTAAAWGTFRDIGNIIMVILVLFVIISQVTGYGIDNYGIKKILPKLIVGALLINLSYIICQVSVDLSNIVGNGSLDLLNGLAANIAGMSADVEGGVGANVITGLGTAGITAVLGYLGVMSVFANLALVLGIISGIITYIVSVFTLFLLLAVRKAAVVILVAASPIAFACYILPNTKKIFDKWLSAFKAMLLLYPICGLVMGGANLAQEIILSSGDASSSFFLALTAMIVGAVPFFFIPSLVRSSFAALGNIGNKISGVTSRFGQRTGKAASGAVGRSAGFRALSERTAKFRANQIADRINNGGRFTRAGKSRTDKLAALTAAAAARGEDVNDDKVKARLEEEADAAIGRRRAIRLAEANKTIADREKADIDRSRYTASGFVNAESVRARAEAAKAVAATGAIAGMTTAQQNDYVRNSAAQAGFMTREGVSAVNQFGRQYKIDSTGNTLLQNADGSLDRIDKDGNHVRLRYNSATRTYSGSYKDKDGVVHSASYSDDEVNKFDTVSYGQAKSQGMDVMRAADYGRTAGYARSDVTDYASQASALTGLNQSTDMAKNTIIEGADSVLKLRHDKGEDTRNATIGLAKEGTHVTSVADYQQIAHTREQQFEIKNYSEKLQSMTAPTIELDMRNNFAPANGYKLAASVTALESKGDNQSFVRFAYTDSQPMTIEKANAFIASKSAIAQEYGKYAGKEINLGNVPISFKDFVDGTGAVKLSAKFEAKPEIAQNMSDDDLEILNEIRSGSLNVGGTPVATPGANTITDTVLLRGLTSNKSGKSLEQFINYFNGRFTSFADQNKFLSGLSYDNICKLDQSVIDGIFTPTFVANSKANPGSILDSFAQAAHSNPNLLSKIPQNLKEAINNVYGNTPGSEYLK